MKRSLGMCLVVAALSWVGCDDGSGGLSVDRSKKIKDVTTAESKAICEDFLAAYPEKTVDCGGGETQKVGVSATDCDDEPNPPSDTCEATVGDAWDCTAALYANPCTTSLPAVCAPLAACEDNPEMS